MKNVFDFDSTILDSLIFEKEDEQFKIKKYIDGYKKIPEKINDIVQLEQVQFEILDKDF